MSSTKQKNGFTIIEVVLVIAIAALIFLMVFIALPALQRGQANTARKNDLSSIATAVSTYRSNHRGSIETLNTGALKKYVDSLSRIDQTSVTVAQSADDISVTADSLDKAYVFKKAKCDQATNQAISSSSAKQAASVTVVEISNDKFEPVCQES